MFSIIISIIEELYFINSFLSNIFFIINSLYFVLLFDLNSYNSKEEMNL